VDGIIFDCPKQLVDRGQLLKVELCVVSVQFDIEARFAGLCQQQFEVR